MKCPLVGTVGPLVAQSVCLCVELRAGVTGCVGVRARGLDRRGPKVVGQLEGNKPPLRESGSGRESRALTEGFERFNERKTAAIGNDGVLGRVVA